MPTAANVAAVADAIRSSAPEVEVQDAWDRWSILAVQGPASYELVDALWPGPPVSELKLHRFRELDFDGRPGLIARTGYTGEPGVELYVPTSHSVSVFRSLLEKGAAPVGLGARDTLRLEMGYALYGHEISLDINPLEAGLGWVIAWETSFRGRDALLKIKEAGADRKLFGVRCTGRGVPRQGYPVLSGSEVIGEVTSGNFSPTLGTGIALALGPADRKPGEGERVAIEARGRAIEGDIVKPPFVPRGRKASTS